MSIGAIENWDRVRSGIRAGNRLTLSLRAHVKGSARIRPKSLRKVHRKIGSGLCLGFNVNLMNRAGSGVCLRISTC